MESGQDYNPVEDCEETRNRYGPRGKRPVMGETETKFCNSEPRSHRDCP